MEPILNIENLMKTYGTVPNQTKALNGTLRKSRGNESQRLLPVFSKRRPQGPRSFGGKPEFRSEPSEERKGLSEEGRENKGRMEKTMTGGAGP